MSSVVDLFDTISPEKPLLTEVDMTMATSELVTAKMDTSACDQYIDASPTDFSTPNTSAISPSLNSAPSSYDSP